MMVKSYYYLLRNGIRITAKEQPQLPSSNNTDHGKDAPGQERHGEVAPEVIQPAADEVAKSATNADAHAAESHIKA